MDSENSVLSELDFLKCLSSYIVKFECNDRLSFGQNLTDNIRKLAFDQRFQRKSLYANFSRCFFIHAVVKSGTKNQWKVRKIRKHFFRQRIPTHVRHGHI